ncbi:hypothetical protein P3T30_003699 [Kitasatospora sp. MAP12-9]|nr:hypothetical protein [Kitasatospora sp. MAP12-44]
MAPLLSVMIAPNFKEDVVDRPTDAPEADRRDADGGRVRIRPGDVLVLECPFSETTVTGVTRGFAHVRWPWREMDPLAKGFRWDGDFALPTAASHGWETLYFRSEPTAGALKTGDACLVGIPPTQVHVVAVHHFDPPLVTGMLPRPACYVEVLPQGESHDPDLEEQAFTFDPAGGEPMRLELLFRPYAFLEPGDEVTDRDGRAWRFDAAWAWHPFDDGQPSTPAWPLALLSRNGKPTPEQAAAVARATAAGNHAEELGRWTEHTLAKPPTDRQ